MGAVYLASRVDDEYRQQVTVKLVKPGLDTEGILRRSMSLPSGFVRDSVYFSIIDAEWPAVRERLERLASPS